MSASTKDGGRGVPPLCVDLDGTLVRTDLLWESLVQMLRRRPLELLRLPLWLARGRARTKEKIADAVQIDASVLPYNAALLERLRDERGRGRRIVLATASHLRPAHAVADHVGLFDEVLATGNGRNLKGSAKRAELVERFGENGFDYAGDSAADLEVWPSARRAIAVDAPSHVLRRLGDGVDDVIRSARRSLPALILSAMRVRQWVKNLLVFVPVVLAHRYLDLEPLSMAALGFLSLSLAASAAYVVNDMLDVEADRHHPDKRRRPFASGELPLQAGFVMAPLLIGASVALTLPLPMAFRGILALYLLTTMLYSFFLKEVALLDVLVLAGLFTVRIIGGASASGVHVSEWLLAFSMFIFLSLAAVKRYAELRRLAGTDSGGVKLKRRGYFKGDEQLILLMGVVSGFMAVLVLALYISSEAVTQLYDRPQLLWFACPLMLYWIGRIWLLAHRGVVTDDPLMFAVRDLTTWLIAGAGSVILLIASRWA